MSGSALGSLRELAHLLNTIPILSLSVFSLLLVSGIDHPNLSSMAGNSLHLSFCSFCW